MAPRRRHDAFLIRLGIRRAPGPVVIHRAIEDGDLRSCRDLHAQGASVHAEDEQKLLPLAFDLCTDYIAEVRIAAVGQVGHLVRLLIDAGSSPTGEGTQEDPALAEGGQIALFIEHVVEMARGTTCFKRANCVQICTSLLGGLPPAVGASLLLPPLLPLASDRVANVRLALATLCKEVLKQVKEDGENTPMWMESGA